jgi:hypothetical protein
MKEPLCAQIVPANKGWTNHDEALVRMNLEHAVVRPAHKRKASNVTAQTRCELIGQSGPQGGKILPYRRLTVAHSCARQGNTGAQAIDTIEP